MSKVEFSRSWCAQKQAAWPTTAHLLFTHSPLLYLHFNHIQASSHFRGLYCLWLERDIQENLGTWSWREGTCSGAWLLNLANAMNLLLQTLSDWLKLASSQAQLEERFVFFKIWRKQSCLDQKFKSIYLCLLDRFPLSWLSVTQEKTSSWPILTLRRSARIWMSLSMKERKFASRCEKNLLRMQEWFGKLV